MNNIVIDPKKIAEAMVLGGVNPEDIKNGEYDGWTPALLDTLEELYMIETKVESAMMQMIKDSDNLSELSDSVT